MKTFSEFLEEKLVDFGFKAGHSPGRMMAKVVKPAKPYKPVYDGLHSPTIYPVPRAGRPVSSPKKLF